LKSGRPGWQSCQPVLGPLDVGRPSWQAVLGPLDFRRYSDKVGLGRVLKNTLRKTSRIFYNQRKHSGMGVPRSIPPRNVFRPAGQYTILSCGNWFYHGLFQTVTGFPHHGMTVRTKIWLHLSDRIV
jgi:hypothetical protein